MAVLQLLEQDIWSVYIPIKIQFLRNKHDITNTLWIVSVNKSSMSTSDDDMIPMQEFKIEVPIIVTNTVSSIPIITLTEPDDDGEIGNSNF